MGLIKALGGAVGGNLADQWKEMIYCDSLDQDTLMIKGKKRTNDRTSNTKRDENIISNGSAVIVNDGQCMIIVEQGKVVEVCAEPGQFTYNNAVAPTIFTGPLGKGIEDSFRNIGKRFTMGGDTGVDQRVYYCNIKEIMGNKYGTASPVPFRVVDTNIGLDVDIAVRCNGEYSYKIEDPILFYTNIAGNVGEEYTRDLMDSQLRSELLTALQPAFAEISAMGIRYSAIPAHTSEMADVLNQVLSEKWQLLRGVRIVSFGVNSITASEEDENLIKELQKSAVLKDPNMAAATIAAAQADAMRYAAANDNAGAFAAFAGMGMAANAGGANAANLYQQGGMAGQQPVVGNAAPNGGFAVAAQPASAPVETPVPEASPATDTTVASSDTWTCPKCGSVQTGNFCGQCGEKRPVGAPVYRCNKCGWQPSDPTNPPKFCPECGDPFNDGDVVS
jgi:membrane protease subunit (stomatin/prohibitin family)